MVSRSIKPKVAVILGLLLECQKSLMALTFNSKLQGLLLLEILQQSSELHSIKSFLIFYNIITTIIDFLKKISTNMFILTNTSDKQILFFKYFNKRYYHSGRWTKNNSKCFGWTQSDNNRTIIPRGNFKLFYAFKMAMAIAFLGGDAAEAI